MGNVKAKLLVNGHDSRAQILSLGDYQAWHRKASVLDRATHLAIDIDVSLEELKALKSVVDSIEELSIAYKKAN